MNLDIQHRQGLHTLMRRRILSASASVAVLLGFSCSHVFDAALAKRIAPPVVNAITQNGITYSACHSSDPATVFVASVVATVAKSKKQLWKTELYQIKYDTTLERDVQEVFIKSLSVKGKKLIAVDESGKQYSVDAKTGLKN